MTIDIQLPVYEQLLSYVSRETVEKLKIYVSLINEWNRQTSLIQINTFDDIWSRHVLDSLQLIPLINDIQHNNPRSEVLPWQIIDIGTGAGFPGMALAISGVRNITLCESNVKKCIFLEEVARLTETKVLVINERVEKLNPQYDIILSRACADLTLLFSFAHRVSRETGGGRALFHKGKNVNKEILEAEKKWSFSFCQYPSILESEGCILEVFDIKPK